MSYLAIVLLVIWTLLTVQTLVNLMAFPRLSPKDPPGHRESWPMVSIIIPARNEERSIGTTIDAALAQDYPRFEVVPVDDDSNDGTAVQIATRATDPRLIVVTCPPLPTGWLGKPHALSQGAAPGPRGSGFYSWTPTFILPRPRCDKPWAGVKPRAGII